MLQADGAGMLVDQWNAAHVMQGSGLCSGCCGVEVRRFTVLWHPTGPFCRLLTCTTRHQHAELSRLCMEPNL